MVLAELPSYPNWQRKRIQNPCSVSSNLTEGTTRLVIQSQNGRHGRGLYWVGALRVGLNEFGLLGNMFFSVGFDGAGVDDSGALEAGVVELWV